MLTSTTNISYKCCQVSQGSREETTQAPKGIWMYIHSTSGTITIYTCRTYRTSATYMCAT